MPRTKQQIRAEMEDTQKRLSALSSSIAYLRQNIEGLETRVEELRAKDTELNRELVAIYQAENKAKSLQNN